jgi:hypothetical protein
MKTTDYFLFCLSLDQYSNSFANTFTFYGQMNNSTPQPSNEADQSEGNSMAGMLESIALGKQLGMEVMPHAPKKNSAIESPEVLSSGNAASGKTLEDAILSEWIKLPNSMMRSVCHADAMAFREAALRIAQAVTAPILAENETLKKELSYYHRKDKDYGRTFPSE